jgi:hypothetical protein
VQPYIEVIEQSPQFTLIYEVCRSVVQIQLVNLQLIQLVIVRLRSFLESGDQNMRFICLASLNSLLKLSPKLAAQNRELTADCLDSEDENQRMIALELLGR